MALKTAPEAPFVPSPKPNNWTELAYAFTQIQQALYRVLSDIAYRLNRCLPKDGSEVMEGPVPLAQYETADLPDATENEGGVAYDSTTNTVKYSNGSAWVDTTSRIATLEATITALEATPYVIQEVIATSTTTDQTTAATMQNSSLSGTITPQFSNSVIEVEVDFPIANAVCVTGSTVVRYFYTEIRNTTNSVSSPQYLWGRNLTAASSAVAQSHTPVHMRWRYTVNSTDARTFTVRYMSGEATNIRASLDGASATATMTLREIKQ